MTATAPGADPGGPGGADEPGDPDDLAPVDGTRPTADAPTTPAWLRLLPGANAARPALRLVERNLTAWRRIWFIFAAGLVEPVLYLLAIGIGVGNLVGTVAGPGGNPIAYQTFVAPGLLASAAMTSAVLDTTFNFFVKLKYFKVYDAVLATPLRPMDLAVGEGTWSLLRSGIYAAAFLLTMVIFGLVPSWWALLAVPAAVLIGFAFAGAGMAASTYMRSFVDFDYINLAILPLFLFSGIFFPVSRYPEGLQAVVQLTPLYQGVALERALVLGDVGWDTLAHVAYLVVMGLVCLRIAGRRLATLLQP